jgi:hypothetical protein
MLCSQVPEFNIVILYYRSNTVSANTMSRFTCYVPYHVHISKAKVITSMINDDLQFYMIPVKNLVLRLHLSTLSAEETLSRTTVREMKTRFK